MSLYYVHVLCIFRVSYGRAMMYLIIIVVERPWRESRLSLFWTVALTLVRQVVYFDRCHHYHLLHALRLPEIKKKNAKLKIKWMQFECFVFTFIFVQLASFILAN